MPLTSAKHPPRTMRVRPAGPRCRGGASSVLRLTPAAATRVPSRANLAEWLSRAADVVMPVTGPHFTVGAR